MIDLRPDFIRHDRIEGRTGQFDRQVHLPGVSRINDGAGRPPIGQQHWAVSHEESSDFIDRLLRRGQADALQGRFHQSLQSFHGQRQVRPAPVADHRVNLIDDQCANRGEHLPSGHRGEQQIKRFRRRHKNVRRFPGNGLPLRGRRVARADLGAHFHVAALACPQRGADSGERFLEVLMNVVAEGFEGRDVQDPRLVLERSGQPVAIQLVQRG